MQQPEDPLGDGAQELRLWYREKLKRLGLTNPEVPRDDDLVELRLWLREKLKRFGSAKPEVPRDDGAKLKQLGLADWPKSRPSPVRNAPVPDRVLALRERRRLLALARRRSAPGETASRGAP